MNTQLLSRIRNHVRLNRQGTEAAPISIAALEDAELKLGFQLPSLLRSCYLEIGNGGFGPGYGLIGFAGGTESDFGSIVDTFNHLQSDQRSLGKLWPAQLLPFCDWGCNIFSCVDCSNERSPVHTVDAGKLMPQEYELPQFFEMWIDGNDIPLESSGEAVTRQISNPFTGAKASIQTRRKD